ncbi:ArsR/SmtB family transcription factor [Roseospira marina]|nr:metalloregulator ArsR/SmtB family transcription factor [Roseospira marina]MBB4313703.1 ArsR family transcriptional regulator [Roseospira marina]MBB5086865.1 ArsR family transcriptional regulator [Roseospira marina]
MIATMDQVLAGLRAAGEETRLRLLALCARGELTVTDMVSILGLSQPRVSRHLKVMCDSGLLERVREGTWVFYRLAAHGPGRTVARAIVDLLPEGDPVAARDRERHNEILRVRAEAAQAYFRANADQWDDLRRLHADERRVEESLLHLLPPETVRDLLDVGTGTGRMLALYAPHIREGLGLDLSREMLAVARANLDEVGATHCQARLGDLYHLPCEDASRDAVTVHQVLHYVERPSDAVRECARVLRPGGRLVIVDFAPHDLEDLRERHQHRRLGFAHEEVSAWCSAADLDVVDIVDLPGGALTVTLWLARRPLEAAAEPRTDPSDDSREKEHAA